MPPARAVGPHLGHPQDHPWPADAREGCGPRRWGRQPPGNLSDWVMFKDNHLDGARHRRGGCRRARWPGPDGSCTWRSATSTSCSRRSRPAPTPCSSTTWRPRRPRRRSPSRTMGRRPRPPAPARDLRGGITLETAAAYAATGADLVSTGAITNSAPALDIGLDIVIRRLGDLHELSGRPPGRLTFGSGSRVSLAEGDAALGGARHRHRQHPDRHRAASTCNTRR